MEENKRSNKQVDQMIEYLRALNSVQMFDDDNVTANEDRMVNVCKAIDKALGIHDYSVETAPIEVEKLIIPMSQKKGLELCLLKDISGSMGVWETKTAEKIFNILNIDLKQHYKDLYYAAVAYSTEAEEYDIHYIFNADKSGGTIVSTGFKKAIDLLEEPASSYKNQAIILFSDGDNLTSDNNRVKTLIENFLADGGKLFYFELNVYNRISTLGQVFRYNFKENMAVIRNEDEIMLAIKDAKKVLGL